MNIHMLIVSVIGMAGSVVGSYPFDDNFLNAVGAFFFVGNAYFAAHWLRA